MQLEFNLKTSLYSYHDAGPCWAVSWACISKQWIRVSQFFFFVYIFIFLFVLGFGFFFFAFERDNMKLGGREDLGGIEGGDRT